MVTVEWLEGRSVQTKQEVAAGITKIIADLGQVDAASIWVRFDDVSPQDWAIGGVLRPGS